jgi:penicillin-binding protein 1B
MASRRKKRSRGRKSSRRQRRGLRLLRLWLPLAAVAVLLVYVGYLDYRVQERFEGTRWALPAHVFARPLELYLGAPLTPDQLTRELERLGYRFASEARRPGQVSRNGSRFHLYTRPFRFWDGQEPAVNLSLSIEQGSVTALTDRATRKSVDLVRLDPMQIGAIYPAHREDRILVKIEEVPPILTDALLAVEDREFYQHHGISLRSVLRALVANLKAGGVVQGGSTLTQQLVKNFYLSNERSLRRKVNEAIMSLLLELHYSKDEILEAYLNEVYLGQDGSRAIHGFGLASQFYFERDLSELADDQVALLVGLVKGPSYYDPRRHPQRARQRRNLVLDLMAQQGYLSDSDTLKFKAKPLGTLRREALAVNAFPAFLDLVRRQLRRDYREEDLNSQGLRIFTTLDPALQTQAVNVLQQKLAQLERQRGLPADSLQGALLVTRTANAEVMALVGERDAASSGFNRALDALRPIGSLIKPAVYLSAIEDPSHYTLASLVDDTPLTIELSGGRRWQPANYDKKYRQRVTVYEALVHSLNVPTARVGLDIGVNAVIRTLHQLGVGRDFKSYPALLLGAANMTPADVTQMYQTLAAGGFRSPLRSITAIVAADGTPLQRYPLRVEQVAGAGPVFLINTALQGVVREGTAASLGSAFSPDLGLAGKTGTTNDLRDSWFAGFSGDLLGVVWLGRDDNQPMGLSGTSGALQVWKELMSEVRLEPLILSQPPQIEMAEIHLPDGLRADRHCENRVQLPFLAGSAPQDYAACARGTAATAPVLPWLKEVFGR